MKGKKGITFWMFSFWSVCIFTYSLWIFITGAMQFLPEMIASVRAKHRRTTEKSGIDTIRYKVGKELTSEEIEEEENLQQQRKKDPFNKGVAKNEGGLTWYYNLDDALEVGRIQDKQILVLFLGSDWSIPCEKLKTQVVNTWRFRTLVGKYFILVGIDMTKKYKNFFVANPQGQKLDEIPNFFLNRSAYIARKIRKFNIKSFPTALVFSTSGNEMLRLQGLGNVNDKKWPSQFMDKLEKVSLIR